MGYTTEFSGSVSIDPPLNQAEIDYLTKFSESRRLNTTLGPYYVDGGSNPEWSNKDIINYNNPPKGQPGLWCQWVPTDEGTHLVWDGNEKFYESKAWMTYIIEHFLKPNCVAKDALPFLQANHTVNGVIHACGEEQGDVWDLNVTDNVVTVDEYELVKKKK